MAGNQVDSSPEAIPKTETESSGASPHTYTYAGTSTTTIQDILNHVSANGERIVETMISGSVLIWRTGRDTNVNVTAAIDRGITDHATRHGRRGKLFKLNSKDIIISAVTNTNAFSIQYVPPTPFATSPHLYTYIGPKTIQDINGDLSTKGHGIVTSLSSGEVAAFWRTGQSTGVEVSAAIDQAATAHYARHGRRVRANKANNGHDFIIEYVPQTPLAQRILLHNGRRPAESGSKRRLLNRRRNETQSQINNNI
ncbi:hypothetical protein Ddc_15696 [Ditylenchus destructor]|nr:hypothetical protein Ddc_15696 [Ditylenchus destructor]